MPPTHRCHHCHAVVRTEQGLKSHITRLHPKLEDPALKCSSSRSDPPPQQHESGDLRNSVEPTLPSSLQQHAPGDRPPTSDNNLSIFLGQCRSSLRILRRIPKGARNATASALATVINACIQNNTVANWENLLQFTAYCLRVPISADERHRNLTTAVKSQVSDFMRGDTKPLVMTSGNATRPSRSSQSQLAKIVQTKISDGDVRGAVRLLGSTEVPAINDLQSLDALRKLHPSPTTSLPSMGPSLPSAPPQLKVSESAVIKAVAGFPAGSAGGPDLMRPQHLKDLLSYSAGEAGRRLLTALTDLCNLILCGEVPTPIRHILFGATLCAFSKKNNGIRPIAIGCTLRRLLAKLCSFHIAPTMSEKLQPTQFGFGVKGGLEIATHLTRRYVHSQPTNCKVLLKIDFTNAFNTVDRTKFLHNIAHDFPEISNFVNLCYGTPTSLLYGEHVIPSARGVQQGDPLGPALFCSAIHPVVAPLASELNVWYLDDGTLGGDSGIVLKDFTGLVSDSAEVGLAVNELKCELFCIGASPAEEKAILSSFRKVAPQLQLHQLGHCTQLGTPLFPEGIPEALQEKINTLELMSRRVKDLPLHTAFFVLKHSLSSPRLTHLLRSAPTWLFPSELAKYDSLLRQVFESLTNVSLSDLSWTQTSWPVAKGGLGLRHASDLSLPAFLASSIGYDEQVRALLPSGLTSVDDPFQAQGLEKWRTLTSLQEPPTQSPCPLQRDWELPLIDLSIRETQASASSPTDKARLLGVSSSTSGAFLNALPSSNIGTLMDSDSFRIALALRLGAPVCLPHICQCGTPVPSTGIHGLHCRKSAGRTPRHQSVNSLIQRALGSAGVPASLEQSTIFTEVSLRPDGITTIPWRDGKVIAWDFTCTDSLAPSHLDHSSNIPLYAASLAADKKKTKYAPLTNQHLFVPIACECLGSFDSEGLAFLKDIGRRITRLTGEHRASEFLMQRISIAIQKGNALSVLGTLPPNSNLDECLGLLRGLVFPSPSSP